MGSAGTGGATHVSGELFQMMAGIKMLHVPYRGSPPALSDLLAGRVQVMFDNVAASIALIRSGKLRPLAVSSRTDALPGVPPISDFLPGYEAYVWNGVVAPKDCPAEIVDKLNGAINAIVTDAAFKSALDNMGNTAVSDTPGRVRQDHRRRHGKMGQGGAVRRHQAGVIGNQTITWRASRTPHAGGRSTR